MKTTSPSTAPTWTSPEPVLTASSSEACSTRTSPEPLVMTTSESARTILMSPEPVLMRASPPRCSATTSPDPDCTELSPVHDVEGDVARARVDAGVGEAAVGDDVAAADLGAEAAGDRYLDDDLGAGVLAEEAAVAPRRDDRDPTVAHSIGEVAHVELLGALAGDPDGGLGRVGGGHVDEAAAVLDVQHDRLGGVEGVLDLVAHRVTPVCVRCVRRPGRRVPVRWVAVRWGRQS